MRFDEEILATTVSYYGQPIGVVAAVTRKLALSAVVLVKVKYKKSGDKLVLKLRDALVAPDKDRRVSVTFQALLLSTLKLPQTHQRVVGTLSQIGRGYI